MRIDRADLLEACHQVMVEYPDSSGARPRQAPTHSRSSLPTVSACIRRFCLDCLRATSGRGAFDCGSTLCPLRPASPFLGKPMSEGFRGPSYLGEPPLVPKRRSSRRLIHAQCRQCQPGHTTDCLAEDCALYPYRPWSGPGHAPRRKASPAQVEAAAKGRQTMRQRASITVGGTFDA